MLKLSGEVRNSVERKNEQGKVFMNSYQVEIANGDKKKLVDLNEFGEKGSFHVGQSIIDVPVKFKKSEYNDDGIEFQAVKSPVSNGKTEPIKPAVKV